MLICGWRRTCGSGASPVRFRVARGAHGVTRPTLFFAAIAPKWLGNRALQIGAGGEKLGKMAGKLRTAIRKMGTGAFALGSVAGKMGTGVGKLGTVGGDLGTVLRNW